MKFLLVSVFYKPLLALNTYQFIAKFIKNCLSFLIA